MATRATPMVPRVPLGDSSCPIGHPCVYITHCSPPRWTAQKRSGLVAEIPLLRIYPSERFMKACDIAAPCSVRDLFFYPPVRL